MALRVNDPSNAVARLRTHWEILDNLMGGTEAMRAAGTKHLPRWPVESEEHYAARLQTATLYPAFARTVGVMAGKPFSKQLTLGEKTPPRIQELSENIDAQGTSLHVVASRICQEIISHGLCGVLVDFTRTQTPEGRGPRTVAEEKALGARPYWVHYNHNQILGWKANLNAETGVMRLTQLRLLEEVEEDDGEFGTVVRKRVRVLYASDTENGNTWFQLWQQKEPTVEEYEPVPNGSGTMAPLTEIPFVPFYGRQIGFLMGRSPLTELAYLNIKHWQSQSDQDTILHVARVPILVVVGGDPDRKITISANRTIDVQVGGDVKWVEHNGQAIKAGQESLEALELQMIQTGAELLIPRPGQRTATEANNEAEGNKSDLQRIVEAMEDGLDRALQFTADWLRLETGGNAVLFKDFGAATLTDASAQLVLGLKAAGLITRATVLREMQRRGILTPDLDVEAEAQEAEAEGPTLGALGRDGDGDGNNDGDPTGGDA